jgi:hypothetical protein
MKVVNQNPMVPTPSQELPRIPVVPSAPSSKLKRSKSNRQFDNMVKVARQLGDNFSRPSMIKLYEEYLDNSSTHYEPDELDLKYYKNIKDIQ